MIFDDIRNESEYRLINISSESVRRYDFGEVEVEINDPLGLVVGETGHRIVDSEGIIHYVGLDGSGFYFNWEVGDDDPHIVA